MDMSDILQLAKEFLHCPVCGSHFNEESISIRGMFEDKFVIQTHCNSGHNPVNAMFISAIGQFGGHNQRYSDPISGDEILDIKNALDTFDGDFEKLFPQERLPSGRDTS